MPLHHAADLLIGQLHRLHGDLQRADLLLCSPQSEVVIRQSLFTCFSLHSTNIHYDCQQSSAEILCPVTEAGSHPDLTNLNDTHKSCGREKR